MTNKKPKKVFTEGPISPEQVAKSIASHSTKLDIEGHGIFLGQVSGESGEGHGTEFTVDVEKAETLLFEIREETFEKFSLTCMHIYHSLGFVPTGAIYLFIFTSSTVPDEAIRACTYLLDRIQKEVFVQRRQSA